MAAQDLFKNSDKTEKSIPADSLSRPDEISISGEGAMGGAAEPGLCPTIDVVAPEPAKPRTSILKMPMPEVAGEITYLKID
jgi:hypothetical protein